MSSEQQKIEHLNEHILYEWMMVRFTNRKLNSGGDRLEWNAFFAANAVYVRNLYDFLKSTKDSRNAKARDYINNFETKDPAELHGVMNNLREQVFHLGKQRVAEASEKVDLTDANKCFNWVEREMKSFVEQLENSYRSRLELDRSDPANFHGRVPQSGPVGLDRPPGSQEQMRGITLPAPPLSSSASSSVTSTSVSPKK